MRGNTYLVLDATSKKAKIPAKLLARLGWEEVQVTAGGKEIKRKKHPTWEEVAERVKGKFGRMRKVNVSGKDYYIIELELSYLRGEVQKILQLQKAGKKAFRILNRSEAVAWLRGEDVFATQA